MKSSVRSCLLAGFAGGLVWLGVPAAGHATTYTINDDDCTGGCGQTQGSMTANFGSVTVTAISSSELAITVTLQPGYAFFESGNGTTFEFNTNGGTGGSLEPGDLTGSPTLASDFTFTNSTNSLDGLGSFQYGVQCNAGNGKACAETSISFDIQGLSNASLNLAANANSVLAGVDICYFGSGSSSSCLGTGPVAVTGAAATTPVPPALALLLPVFGLGYGTLRRARRRGMLATA